MCVCVFSGGMGLVFVLFVFPRGAGSVFLGGRSSPGG